MNLIERARRRRYSAEEKSAVVARYVSSGQTQAAFCREAWIAVPTLSAWRKALTQPKPRPVTREGELVEVALPALTAPADAGRRPKICRSSGSSWRCRKPSGSVWSRFGRK